MINFNLAVREVLKMVSQHTITKLLMLVVIAGFFQAGCTLQERQVKSVELMPPDLPQSYVVYQRRGRTVVRGCIDNHILVQDKRADVALQTVMRTLESQGGGKARIEPGVYIIESPVRIPSQVTVAGSGRATVLKLGRANTAGVVLMIHTKEAVVVSDLTLQGISRSDVSAGIVLHHCGDCEVRNIYARDFSGYGVWVRDNSFMNKLLQNTTSGNNRAGIYLQSNTGKGRGGDYVPNLIVGCTSIGENGHAFELDKSLCVNIVGCQAYQPKGHGFYIRNGSNAVLLTASRCFQGFKNAVLVRRSFEANLSSNIFGWNRGHGIELDFVVWAAIVGNEVIDSGGTIPPQKYGIYMHRDTKSVQVTGNTIFNWEGHTPMICGVYEAEDCRDNQITDNIINYYTDNAVHSAGTNTTVSSVKEIPKFYSHPEAGAFAPSKDKPKVKTPAFTTQRVDKFLELTRY